MRVLVWHWGRRGAGPVVAANLAAGVRAVPGNRAYLSLAESAEILKQENPLDCDWREPTYQNTFEYVLQRLAGPFVAKRVARSLAEVLPDFAICAMPALLDLRMEAALRRAAIPYGVIVHDAVAHPGEALKFRVLDQRRLLRGASVLFPMTEHVRADLLAQGFGAGGQRLEKLWLPPMGFGAAPPPLEHGGRPRLLCFGRLLPYKGLDLLADAVAALGPDLPFELRVCGDGPDSADLDRLRAMPGVVVEHRWIAEAELPGLLAWADGLVLPYREASQSGVAAAAVATGRYVLATNVGGLPEQLAGIERAVLCEPDVSSIVAGLVAMVGNMRGDSSVLPAPDAQADWRSMAAAMLAVLESI